MILKPTVLILGAGASYPYSYPLGGELVKQIVAETNPGGGLLARILQHRLELKGFRARLDGPMILVLPSTFIARGGTGSYRGIHLASPSPLPPSRALWACLPSFPGPHAAPELQVEPRRPRVPSLDRLVQFLRSLQVLPPGTPVLVIDESMF
jgi:hypothetical protein